MLRSMGVLPRRFVFVPLFWLLPLYFMPAFAATVIYYSNPENVYGWCAGFAPAKSDRCAKGYCSEDGSNCQPVLKCNGGWNAIALAEKPARGFGSSCGFSNAEFARNVALSVCTVNSNSLCRTDVAFNTNAKKASAESNNEFDKTWYAQLLLQLQGENKDIPADGRLTNQVIAAVKRFQEKAGLPVTGLIDQGLIRDLIDAGGGTQRFIDALSRDIQQHQKIAEYSFADSPTPANRVTFREEMLAKTTEERLRAFAIFLNARGQQCSIPALSAEPDLNILTGQWYIVCTEGSVTVMETKGGSFITIRHGNEVKPDSRTPEGNPSPAPAGGQPGDKDSGHLRPSPWLDSKGGQ